MNIKELAEKAGVSSDIEDNFIFDAAQLKALVDLVLDACADKCDAVGKSYEDSEGNAWEENRTPAWDGADDCAEAIRGMK